FSSPRCSFCRYCFCSFFFPSVRTHCDLQSFPTTTLFRSWDFNEVRQASSDTWNQTLGQIAVKGNNAEEKVKFYSALYNAHFLPRTFSDVDGSYPKFDGGGQIMKMDHGTYY